MADLMKARPTRRRWHSWLLILSELVAPQQQAVTLSTSNATKRRYREGMYFTFFVYYVLKFQHHSYSESLERSKR